MKWLAEKLFWWLEAVWSRKPDIIIGDPKSPYLYRWYLIPRNRFLNVYLHNFLRDDDDRALHDHPWLSASLCLYGGYVEVDRNGRRTITQGGVRFRSAKYAHRLEILKDQAGNDLGKMSFTLFLTGPRLRNWGFHCPERWVSWQDFTADEGRTIGKGCDQ